MMNRRSNNHSMLIIAEYVLRRELVNPWVNPLTYNTFIHIESNFMNIDWN